MGDTMSTYAQPGLYSIRLRCGAKGCALPEGLLASLISCDKEEYNYWAVTWDKMEVGAKASRESAGIEEAL
jgi:hypothetical protein